MYIISAILQHHAVTRMNSYINDNILHWQNKFGFKWISINYTEWNCRLYIYLFAGPILIYNMSSFLGQFYCPVKRLNSVLFKASCTVTEVKFLYSMTLWYSLTENYSVKPKTAWLTQQPAVRTSVDYLRVRAKRHPCVWPACKRELFKRSLWWVLFVILCDHACFIVLLLVWMHLLSYSCAPVVTFRL
jgi:hypothetical protein